MNSRSIINKKTSLSSIPKSKKILAYCHSQTHEERGDLNIINTLKINKGDEIDTCDLYGDHKKDIKIDLSRQISIDDIKKFKRYDIIYLVNCPSSVYIKGEDFNEDLFRNLFQLLNSNGIIITRLSRQAIEDISEIVIEDIEDVKEALNDEQKKELLLKLQISIHKEFKSALYVSEIKLQDFLKEKRIDLKILTKSENSKFIKSGLNGSGLMKSFIIIQKS